MTSHELAKALLSGPDLPVLINGWGSDEGNAFEAKPGEVGSFSYHGKFDNEKTLKDTLGYALPRPSICLSQDEA